MDASLFGPERSALLVQGLTAVSRSGSPLRMITGLLSGVNLVSNWEKRAPSVAAEIIGRIESVDAIYAQGPPTASLLLALELAEKHGAPVLFDLVAPFDGAVSQGARQSELTKIEERVLTSGHTVMVPTRALKEYFLKKYIGKATHDDIWIVPDFCSGEQDLSVRARQDPAASQQVIILLEMVSEKELKLFMSVLADFMSNAGSFSFRPGIRFIGGEGESVIKFAKKYMPDASVSWSCRRKEEEELAFIRESAVFGLVLGQHESSAFMVPDRLVDALCMNKKLLVIGIDGAAARLARDAGGFTSPLNDSTAVVQALSSSLDDRQSGRGGEALINRERLPASGSLSNLSKILAYMLPV
ncbi:MAG: glycosyltransferase family 4 protein [Chlorobiaceae bacterium]|nr:glycosyltransferase family 4 protein [Chlorobiaceae bacterium]